MKSPVYAEISRDHPGSIVIHSWWLKTPRPALVVSLLALLFGAAMFTGAVPTLIFGHDDMLPLENGWRVLQGLRPHVDFYSAWGPFSFLIPAAGLKLANMSANGIGYGTALLGLFTGLWAYWLSRRRLTSWVQLLFPVYVLLICCAPFPLGLWPTLSGHAMAYNRQGYAVLALVILECFQRAREQDDVLEWAGPISTGAAAALLLFSKSSYFFIALPFVAASFVLWRAGIRRLAGIAIGFSAISFCLLAYIKFDVLAMIHDLRMAAGARSSVLSWKSPIYVLEGNLAQFFLAAATVAACSFIEIRPDWRRRLQLPTLGLLIYGADALLLSTNAQFGAMPLLAALGLIVASRMLANARSAEPGSARSGVAYHASALLFCGLLFVPQMSADVVGLGAGVVHKIHPPSGKGDAAYRFDLPRLAPLVMVDDHRATYKPANGKMYTSYVNEGAALLQKYCAPGTKVLTMDMQNPFPFALNWPPARGGTASMVFDYIMDAQHRPSFDEYFGDAEVVMRPKHPVMQPLGYDGFNALYTPALLQRYNLVVESDQWWLYKKKR